QQMSSERRESMIEIISRAADRMNRLIEDLLTVARVREGQTIAIHVQSENPAELLSEACAMFTLQARAKAIRLGCEVTNVVPTVEADRHRILQVLSNLLDNAIKFTPEGGKITLRCESFEDHVRFAVSDTGLGIETQHVDKIFDLFWQAKPSVHIGGGFGLAI